MAEQPILPRWGSCSWEQVEDITTPTLISNPEKADDKVNDTTILEQEVDQLKQILAQQNQVIQNLGKQLLTPPPPRPVTTTKPHDIPVSVQF